jgi:hypothetical protein
MSVGRLVTLLLAVVVSTPLAAAVRAPKSKAQISSRTVRLRSGPVAVEVRRAASSARVAAASARSTSFFDAHPIVIVPISASAAMLAPNLRAFIPTHLL